MNKLTSAKNESLGAAKQYKFQVRFLPLLPVSISHTFPPPVNLSDSPAGELAHRKRHHLSQS